MVLSFIKANGWPFLPILRCLNKTGPGEVSLIAAAETIINGADPSSARKARNASAHRGMPFLIGAGPTEAPLLTAA
jgi:hypothetical protein